MTRSREALPTGLGALLGTALDRLDPAGRLRLWQRWRDAVGATIAARSEPQRLDDGLLVVRVADHAWCQELQLLKPQILASLQGSGGLPPVRDLYFVVGPIAPAANVEPPRTATAAPAAAPDERSLEDLFADLERLHAERHRPK